MTPEVSHALMSSLKALPKAYTTHVRHPSSLPCRNVAVRRLGSLASETHAATAILSFPLAMTLPLLGRSQPPHKTPHHVDAHGVLLNVASKVMLSSKHQPRSWLKDVASANTSCISP